MQKLELSAADVRRIGDHVVSLLEGLQADGILEIHAALILASALLVLAEDDEESAISAIHAAAHLARQLEKIN